MTEQRSVSTAEDERPGSHELAVPQQYTGPSEPAAPSEPEGSMDAAAPTGSAGESAPVRGRRDPFFDNAKFLAMILVVVGHVLSPMMGRDPAAKSVYVFIYMFHMPVFVVITGYFSRTFSLSRGKARKLITNLAVPYVVFETAYALVRWALGARLEISLLSPYWLTWFLLATFAWRLSTPVWQQLRWPISVAIVISLLSGMTDLPEELAMHRTLGLLPFFVIGLLLEPRHFELLRRPVVRAAGALVLVAGFAGAVLLKDRFSFKWAYWALSNDDLGVGEVTGTVMRLAVFATSLLLSIAFLATVPRRYTWFTGLGGATIYAYLLHGFPIRVAVAEHWYQHDFVATWAGVVTLVVIAAVMAVLLMSPVVCRLTRWAVAPEMRWAFISPRARRARLQG